jgi:hypothetical protein
VAKKTARASTPLNRTAETIGASLGRLAARLDTWKEQRHDIAKEVREVLQSAHEILGQVGDTYRNAGALPTAPDGFSGKGGRPKGYKTSAATQAKLRVASKRPKAASGKTPVGSGIAPGGKAGKSKDKR